MTLRRRPIPLSKRWNRMNSDQRYRLLRRWYPDCWAINSMSLKKWEQLPAQFRHILRTNP